MVKQKNHTNQAMSLSHFSDFELTFFNTVWLEKCVSECVWMWTWTDFHWPLEGAKDHTFSMQKIKWHEAPWHFGWLHDPWVAKWHQIQHVFLSRVLETYGQISCQYAKALPRYDVICRQVLMCGFGAVAGGKNVTKMDQQWFIFTDRRQCVVFDAPVAGNLKHFRYKSKYSKVYEARWHFCWLQRGRVAERHQIRHTALGQTPETYI